MAFSAALGETWLGGPGGPPINRLRCPQAPTQQLSSCCARPRRPPPCSGQPARRGQMGPLRAPEQCPADVAALQRACVSEEPSERPTASEVLEVLSKLPPSRRNSGVPRMPSNDAMVAIEAAQRAAGHAALAGTAGAAGLGAAAAGSAAGTLEPVPGTAPVPASRAVPSLQQRQRSGLPPRTPHQARQLPAAGSGNGSSSLGAPSTPPDRSAADHAAPSSIAAPSSAARTGSLQSPFAVFAAASPAAPSEAGEAGDEAGSPSRSLSGPAAPAGPAGLSFAKLAPQGVRSPSRHSSLSGRSSRRSTSRSSSRALEPVLMSVSVERPAASLPSPFAAESLQEGGLGGSPAAAAAGPAPAGSGEPSPHGGPAAL